MDAVGSAGYGDVGPVVHQDFRPMWIWQRENFACECRELTRSELPLTNLDEFHASLYPVFDGAERGSPIGYQAADHSGV